MRCALASLRARDLLRRGLLAGGLSFVGGCDPALPRQQVVAEVLDLLLALLIYDVVALVGIAREVEVLVGHVAVVVDVLLVVPDARQARVLVVAARYERAILGRREHGRSGIDAAADLVPEQIRHRRQDVELVHRRLDPLIAFPPPGLVDDERYTQPLVVDGVVVLLEAVLVEAFPVVPEDYKGRLLVETQIPVLVEEVAQEVVLVMDSVEVGFVLVAPGDLPPPDARGADVFGGGREGVVGPRERPFRLLPEPLFTR